MSGILDPESLNRKLDEGQAYLDAARFMDKAKADAQALRLRSEIEGFKEGYSAGRKHVLEKVAEIEAEFRQKRETLQASLTEIVETCIEKILGELPRSVKVQMLIRQALSDFPDLAGISIKVAHEELAMFQVVIRDTDDPRLKDVQVSGDTLLKPGDILLETPQGRLHIGMQAQLDRILTNLRRAEDNRAPTD